MRLRRLQLQNYGCFEAADLHLADEPGRITMIVAPNGAGKSVLRQAFHDLLFDIPPQSPMKFRHGYTGMALLAEVIGADGVPFSFGWVRGAKPQRMTTDPNRFQALRGGVTPEQLRWLFALDTKGLRDGGTDLKGGATLAGALLAGTGELAPAKLVQAILKKRRDDNWGKSKSKPPLNAAASALIALRKDARAAVQRPETRERDGLGVEAQLQQHAAAKQAHDDALAQARRLNRIALTRPYLEQLRVAEDWLATHPGAPSLPAGLDQQLADARGAVATAQATHDSAQQALTRAAEAVKGIARDPAAAAIAAWHGVLPGKLGEAKKTAKDLADRRAEHAVKLEDIRSALRSIGADVPVQDAEGVIPTFGLMAEARGTLKLEAGLRTALDLAAKGIADAMAALSKAEVGPAAAAPLPVGLLELLAEIRADRNPIHHAAEADTLARERTAEVTRVLALAPGWAGTAAALRALAVPSETAFERLEDARQTAAARSKEAGDHQSALAAQDATARKSLSALRQKPLPDAASIAAARAVRDHGMRLIMRYAFADAPSAAEGSAYAGAEPVALVYERQVRSADDLADRRTAELQRIQDAERLEQELTDLAAPLVDAATVEVEAVGSLTAAEAAWADAVSLLGLDRTATIGELRKSLAARLQLIDSMKKAETAAGAYTALAAVHDGWAVRLAKLLGASPGPLGALLSDADQRKAAFDAAERAGIERQATITAAQTRQQEAKAALDEATGKLAAWREDWDTLLDKLGRPPGEAPDAVGAVLDGIVTLDQHHRAAVSLQQRISAMQDDLTGFAADVAGLAAAVAQPLEAAPAETARALIARASEAAASESAYQQAQRSLEDARTTAVGDETGLARAKSGLAAVIAACGAATAEEAETRITQSRAHADKVALRDIAQQALLDHGDGHAEAALRADAASVPVEEMATLRHRAEEDAKAAANTAEAEAVALNTLRTAFDAAAGATTAVDLRADQEAAAAEFSRRLEDQLILHIASTMLAEAMRSVEDSIGASSLVRVSQAFSAVTDGAYRLEVHDGMAGEELHAVEHAYPQERKSLGELSEGTRDQLYLALRMVALQDQCASATALPFIADDILQTFDDARAGATLQALRTLSADVQVIVLTHHEHLGRLSADMDGGWAQVIRL